MKYVQINMWVRLLTCFLVLAAVAVQRDGRLLGREVAAPAPSESDSALTVMADGSVVVNTTTIAADIKGYGGPVPLEITIKGDTIASVTALRNAETEGFFSGVRQRLIPQWVGTPVREVAAREVDAVTGATFSSRAVNATVKAGVAYAVEKAPVAAMPAAGPGWSAQNVAVLLVLLCGALVPLFLRDGRYRYVQLALNVVVLGLWSGTFLSYESLLSYVAGGIAPGHALAAAVMLAAAFVYPLFGRRGHYCAWICPLGSLQELAGRSVKRKLQLPPRALQWLGRFRTALWGVLMVLMCAGIWSDWTGYELFTAFIFRQAAPAVLAVAVLFVALSFVVTRPYCRFVCPTGCLFQITQNPDK